MQSFNTLYRVDKYIFIQSASGFELARTRGQSSLLLSPVSRMTTLPSSFVICFHVSLFWNAEASRVIKGSDVLELHIFPKQIHVIAKKPLAAAIEPSMLYISIDHKECQKKYSDFLYHQFLSNVLLKSSRKITNLCEIGQWYQKVPLETVKMEMKCVY